MINKVYSPERLVNKRLDRATSHVAALCDMRYSQTDEPEIFGGSDQLQGRRGSNKNVLEEIRDAP